MITKRQVGGGIAAVLIFLATIGLIVVTDGWFGFALIAFFILAAIFIVGASIVGD